MQHTRKAKNILVEVASIFISWTSNFGQTQFGPHMSLWNKDTCNLFECIYGLSLYQNEYNLSTVPKEFYPSIEYTEEYTFCTPRYKTDDTLLDLIVPITAELVEGPRWMRMTGGTTVWVWIFCFSAHAIWNMRRVDIWTDHTLKIAQRMYLKTQTTGSGKEIKQLVERPFCQMYKLAILHNRFDILGQFSWKFYANFF